MSMVSERASRVCGPSIVSTRYVREINRHRTQRNPSDTSTWLQSPVRVLSSVDRHILQSPALVELAHVSARREDLRRRIIPTHPADLVDVQQHQQADSAELHVLPVEESTVREQSQPSDQSARSQSGQTISTARPTQIESRPRSSSLRGKLGRVLTRSQWCDNR